jgi:hypothetical protein
MHAACPANPTILFIWNTVKVIWLPIMVFSPASCHFLSLIGSNILLGTQVSNFSSRLVPVRCYSNLGTSCAGASFGCGLFNATGISLIYTVVMTD